MRSHARGNEISINSKRQRFYQMGERKRVKEQNNSPNRYNSNCIVVLFCGLKTRQNLSYYLDLS